MTPSVLLYATGGLAYGSLQTDLGLSTFTATGVPVTIGASRSTDKFGWTIGGGIETMFASNWSAKIEYLYMDLGSVSNSVLAADRGRISSRGKRHQSRDGQCYPRRHQLSLLGGTCLLIGSATGEAQQSPGAKAPGLLRVCGRLPLPIISLRADYGTAVTLEDCGLVVIK